MPTPRTSILAITLSAASILGACQGAGPPGLSVASIEFAESELRGLSGPQRMRLGELTAFGLSIADGSLAIATTPVRRAFEQARLVDYATAERILAQAFVTDDNLRAEYSLDPAYELTVRHLIVLSARWEDEATRGAARTKADAALARIRAGEDFAQVAAEISEEPGAEGRQGLLEPGREGAWVGEFWNAAHILDVGAISPVVETQYGFHVLRLEDRATVPFEEARPGVVMDVAQRVQDLLGALRLWTDSLEAAVTLDEAAIASWAAANAEPRTILAEGGGPPLTVADLDRILIGLGDDARTTAKSAAGTPLIRRLAALEHALADAREMGVTLPTEALTTIQRNLDETTARWAAAFGFEPGMSNARVKQAAREAYSTSRQGATIARGELTLIAPGLREHYPIRLGAS